jgi:hypothetical protein
MPAQPVLELEWRATFEGVDERVRRLLAIVRMDRIRPAKPQRLEPCLPGEAVPFLVEVGAVAGCIGQPEDRRRFFRDLAEVVADLPLDTGTRVLWLWLLDHRRSWASRNALDMPNMVSKGRGEASTALSSIR